MEVVIEQAAGLDGMVHFGSPALCVDQVAGKARRRCKSKLAGPTIRRLSSFSRLTCPSVWPLLRGVVTAAA